jgi:cyclopropane fatty-acyl-phospholipid synthase-like methyltransferase
MRTNARTADAQVDIAIPVAAARPAVSPPSVVSYYRETTADYRAWSPNLNMHFGYWRRGLSPFDRERMIEEMTLQVLARLERGGHRVARLADLGCGAGAPAAYLLRARPALRLDGVTLLAEQAEIARAAARSHGVGDRAAFHAMDYTATRFAAGTFDAAMAIESSCHAPGRDKAAFVREAARLLAPGGRLVVADGFLKRPGKPRGFAGWAIDQVARNWAVPCFANIDGFRRALAAHGFVGIDVEEVSWRLGPSVLHIPFVTARVLARYLIRRDLHIGRVRWGHVLASVLAPVVGLMRRRFGYYLISARKRG